MSQRSSTLLTLVVTGLLIAVTSLAGLLWYQSALRNQASELTLEIVQEVLGSGATARLAQAASPTLLAEMNEESLASYVAFVNRRMGALQSIDMISGGIDSLLLPLLSDGVAAHYDIDLQLDNGSATARFDLIRSDSRWRIETFTVDSPLLFN